MYNTVFTCQYRLFAAVPISFTIFGCCHTKMPYLKLHDITQTHYTDAGLTNIHVGRMSPNERHW